MENYEILYCYDPLCGWCYAFSPVIARLEERFGKEIKFTAYSGGMVTGSRVAPINEGFSFIKDSLTGLEERTGIQFGQPFRELVEDGSYIYNSEPACRALTVYKSISNNSSIAFAHALQKSLFYEGKSLNEAEHLATLAEQHQIDKALFLQLFEEEKYKQKTVEEFAFVQRLGVRGFPALLFRDHQKVYALTRGYQAYEPLEEVMLQVLNEYVAS